MKKTGDFINFLKIWPSGLSPGPWPAPVLGLGCMPDGKGPVHREGPEGHIFKKFIKSPVFFIYFIKFLKSFKKFIKCVTVAPNFIKFYKVREVPTKLDPDLGDIQFGGYLWCFLKLFKTSEFYKV